MTQQRGGVERNPVIARHVSATTDEMEIAWHHLFGACKILAHLSTMTCIRQRGSSQNPPLLTKEQRYPNKKDIPLRTLATMQTPLGSPHKKLHQMRR